MALPSFKKPDLVRSRNMRAIRSKGNHSTEWRLRALLVRRGVRGWVLHAKEVFGNPDFLFPNQRLMVFIDGCYWHGCPKCGHLPKTNSEYWTAKLERNKSRDRRYTRELRREGYQVVRIWECSLKRNPARVIQRLLRALENSKLETL